MIKVIGEKRKINVFSWMITTRWTVYSKEMACGKVDEKGNVMYEGVYPTRFIGEKKIEMH